MKRYLIVGHGKEGKFEEREKELEEGTRDVGFELAGEGRLVVGGELEEGGFCMIVECEDSVEEVMADMISIADIEIKPIALCPKGCKGCPPSVVPPLMET